MNFEKIASIMTDEELVATINIFCEEQQQRRKAQCQKLINNFHNAFSELRREGIVPKYYDPYEGNITYIEDWNCLNFD